MTHEEIEQALDQPGFALDNLPKAEQRLLVDTVYALLATQPIRVVREVQALADRYVEGEFRSGWECACDEFYERLKISQETPCS